ncbi:MAG: LAGLIDADG family homing endonuclease [Candidatus Moraniibacteriota bacterium]
MQSKNELCVAWSELAEICVTSVRNLNDWRNEKFSMSFVAVEKICEKRGCSIPEGMVLMDAYWYAGKGASVGGRAIIEKYGTVGGDPEYRKKRWREWWEAEGKFKPSKITGPFLFKKPQFSKELAEFVGIMLGDGGISEHQFTVTLNSVTDKEYLKFVQNLIKKLFDVPVVLYAHKQSLAIRVVISRTALVDYLITAIGLAKGSKVRQQVDIPHWVKENKAYSIACVRGLIDTDGCTIIHQYLSKGKKYCYKKIGFTSRSYPLIQSVGAILSSLGIKHRIMKNKWDVRIEARKDVEEYFQVIGTSNPKHLKRYKVP